MADVAFSFNPQGFLRTTNYLYDNNGHVYAQDIDYYSEDGSHQKIRDFSFLNEPLRAGFQRHFRKPVETRVLFDAVAELAHLGPVERREHTRCKVVATGRDEAS